MNGVDLGIFRFDYDLTWMAFFMDAEQRIYARYGGREDDDAESYLNQSSLLGLMREVLELHRKPGTAVGAAGAAPFPTPERIPTMKAMMARRKNQCIHCHDVKTAELRHLQSLGTFSRDRLFAYPPPSTIGVRMDSESQRRLASVAPQSHADRAGLRPGDILVSANGHRILTAADLVWVLESVPPAGALAIEFEREGERQRAALSLTGEWKRSADPSWRETLHVAGPNGGFWGQKLASTDRRKIALDDNAMAVRVTFVWGGHAKNAGLRVGDVVVEFDGLRDDRTIRQLHAHLHLNRAYGESVRLVVSRQGAEHGLTLRLPDSPPAAE